MPMRRGLAQASSALLRRGRAFSALRQAGECEQLAFVPQVSVQKFREGSPEERQKEIDTVRSAFENQGMALLGDHQIPASVISTCEERSRRFFEMPMERKEQFPMPPEPIPRSYSSITSPRGKAYQIQQQNDDGSIINEWLYVRDVKQSKGMVPYDERDAYYGCDEGQEFYSPESKFDQLQWPSEVPGLEEATAAYYHHIQELSQTTYEIFALALGADQDFFTSRAQHSPIWPVTIAHYPKQEHPPPEGTMRIQPHWDRTLFALVATNDIDQASVGSGLQILVDQDSGHGADGSNGFENAVWRTVPIEPGCIVLNVGEMMARWTNGRFKHVVHRVPNPTPDQAATATRGRISMMAYVVPDYDVPCVASDLDFAAADSDKCYKYEDTTIGELMNWGSKLPHYDQEKQKRMRLAQGLYSDTGDQKEMGTPTDVNAVSV